MPFADDLELIINKINALPIIQDEPNLLPSNYQQIQELAVQKELAVQAAALKALFNLENPDEEAIKQGFLALCHKRDEDNQNSFLGYNANPDSVCNTLFWEIAQVLFKPQNLADMLAILMPSIKEVITVELSLTANVKTKPLNQYFELMQVKLVATPVVDYKVPLPTPQDLNRYAFGNHKIFPVTEIEKLHFNLHEKLYRLLDKYPYLKYVIYNFNPEYLKLRGLIEIAQNAVLKTRIDNTIEIFIRSGSSYTGEFYATDEGRVASDQFIEYIELFPEEDRKEILAMRAEYRSLTMQDVVDHLKKLYCVETAADWLKDIKNNQANRSTLEKVLNFDKAEFKNKTARYGKEALTPVGNDTTKLIPVSVRHAALMQIQIGNVRTLIDVLISLPAEEIEFLLSHATVTKEVVYSDVMARNIQLLGNEKGTAYLNAIAQLAPKFKVSNVELYQFYLSSDNLDFFRAYLQAIPVAIRIKLLDEIIIYYIKHNPSYAEFKTTIDKFKDLAGDAKHVYDNDQKIFGLAIAANHSVSINKLIEKGVDLNKPADERLPLEIVISSRPPDSLLHRIEFLLKNGADPNLLDKEKLMFCLMEGEFKDAHLILELLFQHGLKIAFSKNVTKLLFKLIDDYPQRNRTYKIIASTILHIEVPRTFRAKLAQKLNQTPPLNIHKLNILKLIGANIGKIILKHASIFSMSASNYDSFMSLIPYVPNINCRFDNGSTLLGMCLLHGGENKLVKELLDRGADPNQAIDRDGTTPLARLLSYDIRDRKRGSIATLVEYGAKVDVSDELTVAHCAVWAKNLSALQKLNLSEININQSIPGYDGDCYLLDEALVSIDAPIIEHLLAHGARHNRNLERLLVHQIQNNQIESAKSLIRLFKINLNDIDYKPLYRESIKVLWQIVAGVASYHPLPEAFYERLIPHHCDDFIDWYHPNDGMTNEAKLGLFTHISQWHWSAISSFLRRDDICSKLDKGDFYAMITNCARLINFINHFITDDDQFVEHYKIFGPLLPKFIKDEVDLQDLLRIEKMPHYIKKNIINLAFDFHLPEIPPPKACAFYLANVYDELEKEGKGFDRFIELIKLIILKLKSYSKSNTDFNELFTRFLDNIDHSGANFSEACFSKFVASRVYLKKQMLKVLILQIDEDWSVLPAIKHLLTFRYTRTEGLTDEKFFNENISQYEQKIRDNLSLVFTLFESHYTETRALQKIMGIFNSDDFLTRLKKNTDPIDKLCCFSRGVCENRESRASIVWDKICESEPLALKSSRRNA